MTEGGLFDVEDVGTPRQRVQSKPREHVSSVVYDDGLFEGKPDFTAAEWRFRRTDHGTARQYVEQWHYSRHMPGGGTIAYGAFAPDMACCVMTSQPTNCYGVAVKYDLNADVGNVEISRVVAHPDAPKNTASRAIAGCMRLWRAEGLQWLFSYADTGQNHHGGIYQALNSVYLGVSDGRWGYLVDGKPMHPRSVVAQFGTQAWPAVVDVAAQQGVVIERVEDMITPKHVYILPCGSPAQNRALRRHLADITKPYPKRKESAS